MNGCSTWGNRRGNYYDKMEAMLTTKVCLGLQLIILLFPYSLQHQPQYCLRKEQQIIRVIKCPSEVQNNGCLVERCKMFWTSWQIRGNFTEFFSFIKSIGHRSIKISTTQLNLIENQVTVPISSGSSFSAKSSSSSSLGKYNGMTFL